MEGFGATLARKKLEEGREEGKIEGRKEGKIEGRNVFAIELVRDGDLSIKKAAEKLGKTEDEIDRMLKEFVKGSGNPKED